MARCVLVKQRGRACSWTAALQPCAVSPPQVRNWKRFSWLEWLFVVIAALTILIILGMSIERFVTFEQDFENISMASGSGFYLCNKWTCTNDFIFTVVLVLNIGKNHSVCLHDVMHLCILRY